MPDLELFDGLQWRDGQRIQYEFLSHVPQAFVSTPAMIGVGDYVVKSKLEAWVSSLPNGALCILDLEPWHKTPSKFHPEHEIRLWENLVVSCIEWSRNIRPDLKYGVYGAFERHFWPWVNGSPEVKHFLDIIYDRAGKILNLLDVITPSLYLFGPTLDMNEIYFEQNIKRAFRYGKDCIPFFGARYHEASFDRRDALGIVPEDIWDFHEKLCLDNGCIQAIIWGRVDILREGGYWKALQKQAQRNKAKETENVVAPQPAAIKTQTKLKLNPKTLNTQTNELFKGPE